MNGIIHVKHLEEYLTYSKCLINADLIIVTTRQRLISSFLFLQRWRQLISTLPLRTNYQPVSTKLPISFLFSAYTVCSFFCLWTELLHRPPQSEFKDEHTSTWEPRGFPCLVFPVTAEETNTPERGEFVPRPPSGELYGPIFANEFQSTA